MFEVFMTSFDRLYLLVI